jgi:hypothetical protein
LSNDFESEVHFSSFFEPLLKNTSLTKLWVSNSFTSNGDLQAVKAALECNVSLEELRIESAIHIRDAGELELLFQGIAAIPSLRFLELNLDKSDTTVATPTKRDILQSFD